MTTIETLDPRGASPRWVRIVTWTLQLVGAAAFIAAAVAKLAGVPMLVDIFDQIGIGQWFRYFTAAVEIVGGALLLLPRYASAGAFLLACTMVGATITHLFVLHNSPAAAIVLFIIVAAAGWLGRRDSAF